MYIIPIMFVVKTETVSVRAFWKLRPLAFYPVRKRCTRHRAFYLMLSLACGRIILFVWTPFVQERRHASATSLYLLCMLCLYWACLAEICQLSPFGSQKLAVAYVLQGVISSSASTAARYSKPSVIVG